MKLIPLSQGLFATVDDFDFDRISQHSWFAVRNKNTFYAVRNVTINGKRRLEKMHREILSINDSKVFVDHKNGDGLNNTRDNLRISNNSQNSANRITSKSKITSKYLGVTTTKSNGKLYWVAQLKKDGKIFRKLAKSEIDAAYKYNDMATKHHGEFARLNIIQNNAA